MKKWYLILGLLVLIPFLMEVLIRLDEPRGLIWYFVQSIYYLPISWIGEPFFKSTEIGYSVQPSGYFVGVVIYTVAWFLFLVVARNTGRKNGS